MTRDDYAPRERDDYAPRERDDFAPRERDDYATGGRGDYAPREQAQEPRPTGAFQTPPATPPPATTTAGAPGGTAAPQPEGARDLSIWDTDKADEFRQRWHDVQTHFVEDPRGSVTEARQLVDDAVHALSASVHDREEQLERANARSSDSTEGMRDTILQYHQLLDRILTV
ncbi:hypothetical protein [Dactylosporangium sp. NPDC000521]|uniref:hypothetical protein n=1 Tax=Dactylosporangium sp. NPDC000521 TaxID=3363975 RepID=UPI0036B1DDF4